jgi:hypothetical protein
MASGSEPFYLGSGEILSTRTTRASFRKPATLAREFFTPTHTNTYRWQEPPQHFIFHFIFS